ncbi:MAG: nucleotidyltransferase, partial [Candidatus Omnitrophica bacterium]|nr:nucleotidyltransferase [Candidatus Omnitrophota bacterium]
YNRLAAFHQQHKSKATLAVTLMPDARDYGTIEIAKNLTIEAFKEKQPIAQEAFINTGTYCFDRDVFSLAQTPVKFSIEYDFFPRMIGQQFYGYKLDAPFIDIGTPERFELAQKHLAEMIK